MAACTQRTARRDHLQRIFRAGLQAAEPRACVQRVLSVAGSRLRIAGDQVDLDHVTHVLVIGAGKAAASMAAAVEEILGDRIGGGSINTKYGHSLPLARIRTVECGHPVPDQAGVAGTRVILSLVSGLDRGTVVLCLLSGGGSALLPAPAAGLTLTDKQAATQQLLACGASIDEVNTIRKHLSRIKGGLLARQAQPARVFTLALSDVIGDPLDTIASGPTVPDPTTFADCLDIIARYSLGPRLPDPVLARIQAGARGDLADTPKPDDACFARTVNQVVGNNALAVAAAEAEARVLGYTPLVLTTRLQGDAREVASTLTAIALEVRAAERPVRRPACIICGGETTVTLRGNGRGGRNQELALAAALQLDGAEGISLLSGGTDGTDGPTDAAGAVVDTATLQRARHAGLDAREFLARNDSYHFFQRLNDLVITGPTYTNVMDLQIILIS